MGLDATVWADDECEEELAGTRVGNMAYVWTLRDDEAALEGDYPLLLGRVLYNGTHCGDEIAAQDVDTLRAELQRLPPNCSAELDQFRAEFLQLCQVALAYGRAVSFT